MFSYINCSNIYNYVNKTMLIKLIRHKIPKTSTEQSNISIGLLLSFIGIPIVFNKLKINSLFINNKL